jgi:hypothetical protein
VVTEKATCDICGVEKLESNHWVMVANASEFGVTFSPWDTETYRSYLRHLCGEACAGKLLAQKIAEWR